MEASSTQTFGSASDPSHAVPLSTIAGVLSADGSCLPDTCSKPDGVDGHPANPLCQNLQAGVYTMEEDEWSGNAELLQMVDDMELDYACLAALERCSKDAAD
jgi:hypothetical protein